MKYVGRLSYDRAGNMSGLGMPSGLPELEREAGDRLTGGFAYWGKVTVDDEKKIVIHHVEGSPLMPGWVGGDNVRFYEFEGDLLRLSLKNAEGRTTATLTWRRFNRIMDALPEIGSITNALKPAMDIPRVSFDQ